MTMILNIWFRKFIKKVKAEDKSELLTTKKIIKFKLDISFEEMFFMKVTK